MKTLGFRWHSGRHGGLVAFLDLDADWGTARGQALQLQMQTDSTQACDGGQACDNSSTVSNDGIREVTFPRLKQLFKVLRQKRDFICAVLTVLENPVYNDAFPNPLHQDAKLKAYVIMNSFPLCCLVVVWGVEKLMVCRGCPSHCRVLNIHDPFQLNLMDTPVIVRTGGALPQIF